MPHFWTNDASPLGDDPRLAGPRPAGLAGAAPGRQPVLARPPLLALGVLALLSYFNFGAFHFPTSSTTGNGPTTTWAPNISTSSNTTSFTNVSPWPTARPGYADKVLVAQDHQSAHQRARKRRRALLAHPERCKNRFFRRALAGLPARRVIFPQPPEGRALGEPAGRPRLQRHPGVERRRRLPGQFRRPPSKTQLYLLAPARSALPAAGLRPRRLGLRLAHHRGRPPGARHLLPGPLLLDRRLVPALGLAFLHRRRALPA